jgi:hypothetical protein
VHPSAVDLARVTLGSDLSDKSDACGESAAPGILPPPGDDMSHATAETDRAPAGVQSSFLRGPRRDLTSLRFEARALFIRTLSCTGVSSAPATQAFEVASRLLSDEIESERAASDKDNEESANVLSNACIALSDADSELRLAHALAERQRLYIEELRRNLTRADANIATIRDALFIAQQQLKEEKAKQET